MAPALTQTGEPPNLADTTCHTPDSNTNNPIVPYGNLKGFNNKLRKSSQDTKVIFDSEHISSSLSNGDCVSTGLAPPACGWAEGRPAPTITSSRRSNMDEQSPLPHSDSGNTCVSSEQPPSVSVTPNSNMGLQTCLANVNSAANLTDKETEVVAAVNHEGPSTNPVLNNQNELLALVGRDFDNVNDIIDTLQRLASNPELLDAAARELEPESSAAAQNAPQSQSSEDRASFDLTRLSDRQRRLESRRLFLLRRLRRVTARGLGITVSSQLNYLTRHVGGVLEEERAKQLANERVEEPLGLEMLHKESMKSMSTSDLISLVRRVEASNNLQRLNDIKMKRHGLAEVLVLPSSLCAEMDTVASEMKGAVLTHVSHDSDATESSSGGESCDESETFNYNNNSNASYKPVRERAFYKYCRNRGWVGSKWMWLQAQIADLDYRILQQQKILAHIRKSKGTVQIAEESEPLKIQPPVRSPAHMDMQDPALTCIGTTFPRTVLNGYHPPANKMEELNSVHSSYSNGGQESVGVCARTLGVHRVKRRRYVRPNVMMWKRGLEGIPNSTNKVKVSPIYCKCVPPLTCILCVKSRTNGKVNVLSRGASFNKLANVGAFPTHSVSEKLAKLDAGFHPVLSQLAELLQGEVYSSVVKSFEWRQKNLANKSTALYQRDNISLASSNSLLEPLTKKKKKDKEHKRNGRRKHSKEDMKERITLKFKKSLLTDALEQEGDTREVKRRKLEIPDPLVSGRRHANDDDLVDCDNESGSWQVSVSGSANSSPCPSPVPTLSERDAKSAQLEARNIRKQSTNTRQKQNSTSSSYDINNIVIPYSMAAATRVELIQYKEIPTPKWRVVEIMPLSLSTESTSDDEEMEDISDEAIALRHSKGEADEHAKYINYYNALPNVARQSRTRRADSSGTNTPDHPLSPRACEPLDVSPVGSPPTPNSDTPLIPLLDPSESSSTTVLTLSLSSLQSSLMKTNLPSTEPEENGSSGSHVSSLKCQQKISPSMCGSDGVGVPIMRTRRSLSTASAQPVEKLRSLSLSEDHVERGRISPFPSRNFPLKENEYEDLVSANQNVSSPSDQSGGMSLKSNESEGSSVGPRHHGLSRENARGGPNGTDEESGRDSPLSELTDSAPEEEEGLWNQGPSPPDWTISAVDDRCGGIVLTVQKN